MTDRSQLPLAASRFLVKVGYVFCVVLAIVLLVVGFLLAVAWPAVLSEAISRGLESKLEDLQPWTSLVLFSASVLLAMSARILGRLSIILDTVSYGDPFTADNSRRLRHIGWLMIGMQFVAFFTGLAGKGLPKEHDFAAGFEFSFNGLLAALLAFVVAQLFERARAMREDLEGTI